MHDPRHRLASHASAPVLAIIAVVLAFLPLCPPVNALGRCWA